MQKQHLIPTAGTDELSGIVLNCVAVKKTKYGWYANMNNSQPF